MRATLVVKNYCRFSQLIYYIISEKRIHKWNLSVTHRHEHRLIRSNYERLCAYLVVRIIFPKISGKSFNFLCQLKRYTVVVVVANVGALFAENEFIRVGFFFLRFIFTYSMTWI